VRNRSGALAVADAFGLLPSVRSAGDVIELVTRPAPLPLSGLSRAKGAG
jgi:hypothetical protein